MRKLFVLSVICFLTITSLFAQDIGTNYKKVPLTSSQLESILPTVTETGFISLSVDGLGTNQSSGIIQVNKPVGATVRAAYIAAVSSGFSNRQLIDGDVTIDGAGVNWYISTPSSISSWNHWADVTSLVKPKVDLAPAGLVDFTITEVSPGGIDGEVLAVIFDDPNQTASNTVVLLFGAQDVLGDNFAIGLANPINLGDPDLVLDFSLGISFGFQPAGQYSQVDVNGQRLTTSAGGQDDGEAANGALLTVGGIGDINTNPPDPFQTDGGGPRYDDELYNLIPFVTDGATAINVFTQNPSNDDNIFFAALFLGSTTAIVGEGILLTPLNATNPVGTNHTVTAKVQDDLGNPIVGRTVNLEIVNGPNIGLTLSDVTDVTGEATFTYTSSIVGTDELVANMLNTQGNLVTSNSVFKNWTTVTQFDYMTLWAVSDANDGKLYYYSLIENAIAFLNVEGDILGIQGDRDIEDMKIDDNGDYYFVNNVGTSTIYKFSFNDLDGDENTPVPAVLVGSTGLPTDPNLYSPEEISSLLFYNVPVEGFQSNLYGIGKASKKLYSISKVDGSVTEIDTLNVAGDFRTDGMTIGPNGIVYLLKTNDTGGESELWKFDQFPGGDISYVRQIETSLKVESLSAHPNGYLYASDMDRFFEISVTDSYIGYLADYNVDVEGMDFFYQLETRMPVVPTLTFTPIQGATHVQNTSQNPTEFGLTQNYPNPFNPSTVINYSIPQAGFVKLSVFNLLGEKVATLVDETLQAGNYAVNFNAVNLSSGLYIYKLETESFTQSMKMMLMK